MSRKRDSAVAGTLPTAGMPQLCPRGSEREAKKPSSTSSSGCAAVFVLIHSFCFRQPVSSPWREQADWTRSQHSGKAPCCRDSSFCRSSKGCCSDSPPIAQLRRPWWVSQQPANPTAPCMPTANSWQLSPLSPHLNTFFIINIGEYISEISCALQARLLYGFPAPRW